MCVCLIECVCVYLPHVHGLSKFVKLWNCLCVYVCMFVTLCVYVNVYVKFIIELDTFDKTTQWMKYCHAHVLL